jgi:hypothetical protein
LQPERVEHRGDLVESGRRLPRFERADESRRDPGKVGKFGLGEIQSTATGPNLLGEVVDGGDDDDLSFSMIVLIGSSMAHWISIRLRIRYDHADSVGYWVDRAVLSPYSARSC